MPTLWKSSFLKTYFYDKADLKIFWFAMHLHTHQKQALPQFFYFNFTQLFFKILKMSNVLFVWFDSLRPITNLSAIKGQVFLGWTSTKLGLMFLLMDTMQWCRWGLNLRPLGLESSTQPLNHLLFFMITTMAKHITLLRNKWLIIHKLQLTFLLLNENICFGCFIWWIRKKMQNYTNFF